MNKLYSSIITAKTGTQIPVFTSGRTIESRYNPQNDAERLLTTVNSSKSFFIVFGIGSGLLIKTLLEKNKFCTVLAIENSDDDINFLLQLEYVKEIKNNIRCTFCTKNQIKEILPLVYVPSFYGDMQIIEQRAWITEIGNDILQLQQEIQQALSLISADYSVQTHFGKIWQTNIKNNLQIIEKANCERAQSKYKAKSNSEPDLLNIDTQKIARIIAAGPSLDNKIELLKKERKSSYIIATDTAFSTLLKHNIIPDSVVSIDGQHISQTHFIHKTDFTKTLFIFELTANSNAIKHVQNHGGTIIFCRNEHPLSTLAAEYSEKSIIHLFTGSGTVTIAAADFAIKAGFTQIEVFGADFSYSNGKPYAKGTYLDSIYSKQSSRIQPVEQFYSKLMFRTELQKLTETSCTTKILESYKFSFEEYLKNHNLKFKKENGIYKIENQNIKQMLELKKTTVNTKDFYAYIKKNFNDEQKCFYQLNKTELALLPAAAFYKRKNFYADNDNSIFEFLKLAYNSLVGYN